ncbi:uncharacterized protein LOC119673342 [Teleopsis dalmanni]|uniref:uncharacterized protein LOC119673342 n=1 Tax=Teleopsis dalmanni TaxID=139649 RepID=UPI0018CE1173|nr:uncharacterized protein LOC119673342 [Teleopsis dalmanni]
MICVYKSILSMVTRNRELHVTVVALHLLLIISSAWALKNVTKVAHLSVAVFTILLIYSILSIIRYSHPAEVCRKSWKQISVYGQIFMLMFILLDILKFCKTLHKFWICSTGYIMILMAAIFTLQIKVAYLRVLYNISKHVAVIWMCVVLAVVGYKHMETYWTFGLMVLIVLNHFMFNKLSLVYDITDIEITTIWLSFFIYFAQNVVNEVAVLHTH